MTRIFFAAGFSLSFWSWAWKTACSLPLCRGLLYTGRLLSRLPSVISLEQTTPLCSIFPHKSWFLDLWLFSSLSSELSPIGPCFSWTFCLENTMLRVRPPRHSAKRRRRFMSLADSASVETSQDGVCLFLCCTPLSMYVQPVIRSPPSSGFFSAELLPWQLFPLRCLCSLMHRVDGANTYSILPCPQIHVLSILRFSYLI